MLFRSGGQGGRGCEIHLSHSFPHAAARLRVQVPLVKRASGKNTMSRLDAHHRGAGSGILDGGFTLETGFDPVVNVALSRDVV